MSKYSRFLITGGTGFIGSFLIKELTKSDKYIRCLVRDKTKITSNNKFDLFEGDICNPESIKGACDNIDTVINCAAKGHVSSNSKKDYKEFFDVNVLGSLNLAKESINSGVKKIVHLSSTAAMGLIENEIATEKTASKPLTPYQKSKYKSEVELKKLTETEEISLVILRPCMVYGSFNGGELLRWCRATKKGLFPRIGFGKNLSPLIHVDDLIKAIISAVDNGRKGETYILTSGESYDMNHIIDIISDELGIKFVPRIPVSILLVSSKLIEIFSSLFGIQPLVTAQNIKSMSADRLFDITKAKNELNFNATQKMEIAIHETIDFYKKNNLL